MGSMNLYVIIMVLVGLFLYCLLSLREHSENTKESLTRTQSRVEDYLSPSCISLDYIAIKYHIRHIYKLTLREYLNNKQYECNRVIVVKGIIPYPVIEKLGKDQIVVLTDSFANESTIFTPDIPPEEVPHPNIYYKRKLRR